jgi:hypothetical protein
MSNIKDLLEELDLLKLPKDKYVVVGSGPLGIRGIRESQDLDILVDDKLWDELSNKYDVIDKNGNAVIRISDNIEALGSKTFPNESPENPTLDEQIREAELIKGHPFQSIEHFKFFKEMGRRQKDLDDVILLQNWIDSK